MLSSEESALLRPQESDPVLDFLTTLKLICDTNKIHEKAAMLVLFHYVDKPLAIALNNRRCAEDRSDPLAASEQNEPRSRKLLQFKPEVVY